ncbi:MAG TPA: DNA polymerase IV [Bacillota bacterium]|nr:DNA polymerase IV [Bacillota bacterium]
MKRVIFLVDMNAFFVGCEMARNPSLKGKPVAVAGDPQTRSGIILAANYEARKFGVKTAMVLREALKICPDLIQVHPDHDFYEESSNEVMQVLSTYTPVIEQNSIDEAWLDMTGCEALFGKPEESAKRIMQDIYSKLDLMCSIGISENKFLSKMAADMKKPMGITELWQNSIKEKLWPLPARKMYGVGKQTSKRLAIVGIETIGQLALFDKMVLVKHFGKHGLKIHELANGIDTSPLVPQGDDDMKSIGRSTTLREDIVDLEPAKKIILGLSNEVGITARRHNKRGRTVQITIKYSDFRVITRQMKLTPSYLTRDIYQAGKQLLEEVWDRRLPVRLLGITISGFDEDTDQVSMFEQIDCYESHKDEMLEKAADKLREKHGLSIIKPASLLEKKEN